MFFGSLSLSSFFFWIVFCAVCFVSLNWRLGDLAVSLLRRKWQSEKKIKKKRERGSALSFSQSSRSRAFETRKSKRQMSLSLPPEEELALLRAEVASLRQQLEQVRKVNGGGEEERENGGNASTRSCIANVGDDAIDDDEPFPPPARASDYAFWEADHPLSTPQVERYCRQMLLPWFGPEGEDN